MGSGTVLPVPKEGGVSLLPMLQRGADHFGMGSWQPLILVDFSAQPKQVVPGPTYCCPPAQSLTALD